MLHVLSVQVIRGGLPLLEPWPGTCTALLLPPPPPHPTPSREHEADAGLGLGLRLVHPGEVHACSLQHCAAAVPAPLCQLHTACRLHVRQQDPLCTHATLAGLARGSAKAHSIKWLVTTTAGVHRLECSCWGSLHTRLCG